MTNICTGTFEFTEIFIFKKFIVTHTSIITFDIQNFTALKIYETFYYPKHTLIDSLVKTSVFFLDF